MRTFRIIEGDALKAAQGLPSESAQTIVTSVPYYKKRDYGVAGQIGQEATPEQFIARLVETFREIRRVLKADGTCWVNVADTYASQGGSYNAEGSRGATSRVSVKSMLAVAGAQARTPPVGFKVKDRLGIPHMLVFALRADGWHWRDEIVWDKGATPKPESVKDRCTQAHEFVFTLTKSRRYFYNAEAIAEASCVSHRPQRLRALELAKHHGLTEAHLRAIRSAGISDAGKARQTQTGFGKNIAGVLELAREAKEKLGGYYREFLIRETRNRRSVWTISTENFDGAHAAVMPSALAELCVLAGSREGDTVYDPFTGSGTTGLVSLRLNRNFIGSELNPDYAAMARRRIIGDAPLLNREEAA